MCNDCSTSASDLAQLKSGEAVDASTESIVGEDIRYEVEFYSHQEEESQSNPPADFEESQSNPPADFEESQSNPPADFEESQSNPPADFEESQSNPPADFEESQSNPPADNNGCNGN